MSLLYKPLESITAADLQALIDNQVGESLYLEYKTEVFDKRDDKKKLQFLGSVSTFANAAGGDLLVGVKADNGLPVELPGLAPPEIDSEVLRIKQVVGTGIEPYLSPQFHSVPLPIGRAVLIIRVPRSWTAPHGIEINGHFQFFRRHAAGRMPMTISELRTAFTFSSTVVEQTRKFRDERNATITSAGSRTPS
jgi:predicted HTH transcriptional regulator